MAKDKELPMLNSEKKELLERIKVEKNRADQVFGCVMRKVNGVVIRADYLTTEQKERLIAQLLEN